MRTLTLAAISFGLLFSGLPAQTSQAQDDGGGARLTSAAYAPESPVRENRLFRYQSGHYGFAYNCDGEECKRNNPAICWRKACPCQLPKRMGCLERIRHEVDQVSQRILDGSCNSGCQSCQKQSRRSTAGACGCQHCLASQPSSDTTAEIASLPSLLAEQAIEEQAPVAVEQSKTTRAEPSIVSAEPVATKRRRSGLISVTPLEPAAEVELNSGEVLMGTIEVVPSTINPAASPMESVQLPVAKITSVTVGSIEDATLGVLKEGRDNDVVEAFPPSPPSTPQMGLLERLKRAQTARGAELLKPAKF